MSNADSKPGADAQEPQALRSGVPAWPFILLVVLFFGGMLYVESHGGAFNRDVYVGSMKTLPPQLGLSPEQELYIRGQRVYAVCAACHQPSGGGVPGQFPPLSGSEWALADGPNRVIRLVLDGVGGPMKVKGETYNNVMVPWRDSPFTDEDLAGVITFIRKNKDWGHDASMVTAAQVKAVREATKGHAGTAYTADELLGLPDKE